MRPEPPDFSNDVTRRQWLLRLGEIVALAGVSGIVPEGAELLFAAGQGQIELPPGLYMPSADALVHAMRGAHVFTPPVGSETDYAPPENSPFTPYFFSPDEFQVVTRFAEILLGNVDAKALAQTVGWIDLYVHSAKAVREAAQNLDPLHRAVAVAYFGESSVKELEIADPQAVAREGLTALSKFCSAKYGQEFSGLSPAQQSEVLGLLGNSEDTVLRKFFELIREQTIRGYYTTPEGLRELDYKGNAYYGECPGCDVTGGG
jgi:Gluconate 2-dehydrogenase subunit 3